MNINLISLVIILFLSQSSWAEPEFPVDESELILPALVGNDLICYLIPDSVTLDDPNVVGYVDACHDRAGRHDHRLIFNIAIGCISKNAVMTDIYETNKDGRVLNHKKISEDDELNQTMKMAHGSAFEGQLKYACELAAKQIKKNK
jgi:hypothetical protein